jgi:hypothetical protein
MKIDQVDGLEYWTVTHVDDLLVWEIMFAEPWKEGVTRLHVTNAALPSEFRMLYCSNAILQQRDRLRYGSLAARIVLEDILDAEYIAD